MAAVTVNLSPPFELTDDTFFQLCQNNPDVKFERTANGELVVMSPVGGEGGKREADLTFELVGWNRQSDLGIVFSSSAGFKLPNGADRSPDAAWVKQERWDALTPEQRRTFPPIAPDFVIELRSETDDLETLRAKMREYMASGVRLGWLINPKGRQVEIYRPGQPVEILDAPNSLSGEDVLPGFLLDLSRIL
ncbi:MAG: Uma2 family endonuclease [Cyanothece sp. SIO1E1]|nr:Uma2 family endonuclease [Cyanothece sp. SIO1E1]